jgi:hypothetical protein
MLTSTGTAIYIAETEGFDLGREQCPQLSDMDYIRRRQVWQGTIFLSVQVLSIGSRSFADRQQVDCYGHRTHTAD